jgi:hypothetical protein
MKIIVAEFTPSGHIDVLESAVRLFLSNPRHEVVVFCTAQMANSVRPMLASVCDVRLEIQPKSASVENIFDGLLQENADITFVVTLERYFDQWKQYARQRTIWVVAHNMDGWGGANPMKRWAYFLSKLPSSLRRYGLKSLPYWFRAYITLPLAIARLSTALSSGQHRIGVIHETLLPTLKRFLPNEKCFVLPSALYTADVPDTSGQKKDTVLHICIPGTVSQIRRDYEGLLDMLEKHVAHLSGKVRFEWLGILNKDYDGRTPVFKRVNALRNLGLNIITYDQFVSVADFEAGLGRADIILGNLNIVLDRNTEYGRTKESGLPFTMIKAAKPGILPYHYRSFPSLESSTIFYTSYEALFEQIIRLQSGHEWLAHLKSEAVKNARQYTPAKIYQQLFTPAWDSSNDKD